LSAHQIPPGPEVFEPRPELRPPVHLIYTNNNPVKEKKLPPAAGFAIAIGVSLLIWAGIAIAVVR
jgi:hypothetical protein